MLPPSWLGSSGIQPAVLRFPAFDQAALSSAQNTHPYAKNLSRRCLHRRYVSGKLISRIQRNPEVVLGLATGGTMEPVYAGFVERVRQSKVDVSRLTSFNLDEYVGLSRTIPELRIYAGASVPVLAI